VSAEDSSHAHENQDRSKSGIVWRPQIVHIIIPCSLTLHRSLPALSCWSTSLPHTLMARRLYIGRLPADARSEDMNKFVEGYGRVVDCRVMTGFAFVEFESARDADDALDGLQGKTFMGQK
jgi:hypothetical protein